MTRPHNATTIPLGDGTLTCQSLWEAARCGLNPHHRLIVEFSPAAQNRIRAAEAFVESVMQHRHPVYGINTGVGHFTGVPVPKNKIAELQRNLIRSHCCSVGTSLSRDVVLSMWLIRLNTIGLGHSGTRSKTIEKISALLERGVLAVVPSRGSVGASGDLSPSAHAALTLLGEGFCTIPTLNEFREVPAHEALRELNLEPVQLGPKEGLSLINGTQLTTSLAVKAWYEGQRLLKVANLAAALSLEALHGSRQPIDPRVLTTHRHLGTRHCGEAIRAWLDGPSEIHDTHREVKWTQDPYSLRCAPQVHGAVWEELQQAEQTLGEEINAAADNPLLFPEENCTLSCGNFHAIYPARVSDKLASALTTLASISERRINLAMDSRRTGLPDFLVDDGGVRSGFMMAQVTAAALVSECKSLSNPASVDSIPTNNDQEDHVSMGPIAGFKVLEIVDRLRYVLAIELLVATQALDLRAPKRPAERLAKVRDIIRRDVAPLTDDRVLSGDMELIARRIAEGVFDEQVHSQ